MRRLWLALVVLVLLGGCVSHQNPSDEASASGIRGRTVLFPSCPIEPAGGPCKPSAVSASLVARSVGGTAVVAETISGADGTFHLALAPGDYVISATTTAQLPEPQIRQSHVRIVEGTFSWLRFTFTSGIRELTAPD